MMSEHLALPWGDHLVSPELHYGAVVVNIKNKEDCSVSI